ncbi:hypothetical protein MRX96_016134 [Rhipicephalus microplus]
MARPTALLFPLVLLAPLLVRCSEPQAPALLAALPARSAPALARALRRVLARSGQGPGDSPGPWFAVTLAVDADTRAALAALCAALENHRPLLVVSMAPPPSAFAAALAAGYAKLPVLAYTGGYLDRAAQKRRTKYMRLRTVAHVSASDVTPTHENPQEPRDHDCANPRSPPEVEERSDSKGFALVRDALKRPGDSELL